MFLVYVLRQNLAEEQDKKIKDLQDNIAAVTFTSSGKSGRMLMAKCKTLIEENEEIGFEAAEGKVLLTSFLFPSLVYLKFPEKGKKY